MFNTIDDIETRIQKVKEDIRCHENSDDSYYISPLYHRHLLELFALNNEKLIMEGKMEPCLKGFDDYEPEKCFWLNKLAQKYGLCFADNCRELTVDDLKKLE